MKFSGFKITFFLFVISSAAFADLQWITGGVPKNTEDKSSTTVVKDAPSDQTAQNVPNQDIVLCHLTVSSGNARLPGVLNDYPTNSTNYFFLDKDNQVY